MPQKSRTDLTVPDASAPLDNNLNARPVDEVAAATLKTGAAIIAYWDELEPIAKELIGLVKERVQNKALTAQLTPSQVTSLLATMANVVDKMAKAGQAVLKSSEGQARLHLLLTGGVPKRDAKAMSEKQLAAVVIAAARRFRDESGVCPVCTATSQPVIDV